MDLEAPTVEWEKRCREYVNALEEERHKIQIFQRELPLSLHLVTQTIERYRHQMAAQLFGAVGVTRSELEEGMSSEGAPVLEEFIPIKRSPSSEAEGDEEAGDRPHRDLQHSCNGGRNDEESNSTCKQKPHETYGKKPDWLRSVQLWTPQADPQPLLEEDDDDVHTQQRPIAVDARKATGAFLPFHPQKRQSPSPAPLVHSEVAPDPAPPPPPPVPATSSTCDTKGGGGGGGKGGCGGGDDKDGQLHRKARRCWSPELHRRFISALQQLGGSDVATPKRIRELMRVDGLTNDEVKSHLQKYRLHSRRPSPTARGNTGNPPPQQVVFVGGIWVPPPENAAAAAAVRLSTAEGMAAGHPCGIHAPVASVPAPKHQLQVPVNSQRCPSRPLPREGRRSREEDRSVADGDATRSNSPATSSSSHGTTASPGRRGSNKW